MEYYYCVCWRFDAIEATISNITVQFGEWMIVGRSSRLTIENIRLIISIGKRQTDVSEFDLIEIDNENGYGFLSLYALKRFGKKLTGSSYDYLYFRRF